MLARSDVARESSVPTSGSRGVRRTGRHVRVRMPTIGAGMITRSWRCYAARVTGVGDATQRGYSKPHLLLASVLAPGV